MKRTHLTEDKILELSNVKKYRGYALKIDGEVMSTFVVNTAHFDEKYDRTIIVGKTIETGIIILISFMCSEKCSHREQQLKPSLSTKILSIKLMSLLPNFLVNFLGIFLIGSI